MVSGGRWRWSALCIETSLRKRRWLTEDTYKLSLALAQIMPGPLAAQVAIAIGYFEGGVLGATLVCLAFIIPSFLMVVAISFAYVAYGGLWWMQALFYAIGATVIAIIAIAAYKLARSTNKHDRLLWGIFAAAHSPDRVGAEPSWPNSLFLQDWWF